MIDLTITSIQELRDFQLSPEADLSLEYTFVNKHFLSIPDVYWCAQVCNVAVIDDITIVGKFDDILDFFDMANLNIYNHIEPAIFVRTRRK